MNFSGLSFNALPPIEIPFRYFITAPLFVILIALTLLSIDHSLWNSRWHPYTLAMTHGFTLGFLSSVMLGALLQMLPVLGAGSLKNIRSIGLSCHLLHLLGSFSLMLSFIVPWPYIKWGALILLSLGFGIYLCSIAWLLSKRLSQGPTIKVISFALLALFMTILLGSLLQANSLGIINISLGKTLTNLHATWGLLGWGGLLVIAVSFQVIPMFHVTPAFSNKITRFLPLTLLMVLLVLTTIPLLSTFSNSQFKYEQSDYFLGLGLLFVLCVYSVNLLKILRQRKRKVPDTTINYWQLATSSIFILTTLYLLPNNIITQYLPTNLAKIVIEKQTMLYVAIFIYFYLISIIEGMLLKILPFLSYTHLQQRCLVNFEAMAVLPHMHDFLKKKHGKYLFILHILTGISLLITILFPVVSHFFALLLLLEFSWLLYLMLRTQKLYRQTIYKIELMNQVN